MLLLKRHLVELVRAGKKNQKIRLWRRPLVRPGQISFSPGLGRLRITAVDELESLEVLTEADARADGFDSLPDLLREIRTIYAPPARPKQRRYPARAQEQSRRLYRVRFEWPLPEHLDDAEKAGTRSAKKIARGRLKRRRRSVSAKGPSATPTKKVAKPRRKRPARDRAKAAAQRRALHAYILSRKPAPAAHR
jgi:hypothetical protein